MTLPPLWMERFRAEVLQSSEPLSLMLSEADLLRRDGGVVILFPATQEFHAKIARELPNLHVLRRSLSKIGGRGLSLDVDVRGKKRMDPPQQGPPPKPARTQRQDYQKYLKSEVWKRTRELATEYYGEACCLCNSTKFLNVHHRTYARLGHERLADLILLCRDCHRDYHAKT